MNKSCLGCVVTKEVVRLATICASHKTGITKDSIFPKTRGNRKYPTSHTVPAPIKDAASIQKSFFESMHYDAFHPKLFNRL